MGKEEREKALARMFSNLRSEHFQTCYRFQDLLKIKTGLDFPTRSDNVCRTTTDTYYIGMSKTRSKFYSTGPIAFRKGCQRRP
jgi:hypothetical protein